MLPYFQVKRLVRAASWLAIVAVAALLGACNAPEAPLSLPGSIEGGWVRGEEKSFESAGIQDALKRLSVVSSITATYTSGERSVRVDVHQMPSATAAFEALQTYHRQPDQYYYHVGASFIVLHLNALSPDERRPFLLAFQAATQPHNAQRKANE